MYMCMYLSPEYMCVEVVLVRVHLYVVGHLCSLFKIFLRPEKLFLIDDKSVDINSFTGTVEESIYQGESQLLIIRLNPASHGDQLLRMRIPNGSAALSELPLIGSKVTVGLKKSDSYLVE